MENLPQEIKDCLQDFWFDRYADFNTLEENEEEFKKWVDSLSKIDIEIILENYY